MSPSLSRPPRRPARPSSASTGRDRAGSETRVASDRAAHGGARRRRAGRLVLTRPWKLVRALLILVAVVALVGVAGRALTGHGIVATAVPTASDAAQEPPEPPPGHAAPRSSAETAATPTLRVAH